MEKVSNLIDAITKKTVLLLFSVIIAFLTIASLFGNCYVNNDEYTYYVSDRAYLHCVVLFLIFVGAMLIKKKNKIKIGEKTRLVLWYILLAAYTVIMIMVTLYVSMEPRADQKSVYEVAIAMIKHDYSAFDIGGYMDVYPNQVGIVYFFYWIFQMFPFGYKTICVINAISLGGIVIGMSKIGQELSAKNNKYAVGIMTLLFFPISCYCTFVYGNLMGQALSTLGIWMALKYINNKEWKYVVLSILLNSFAILIKENFLIPMIGVCIWILLDGLRTKKIRSFVFLVGLVVGSIVIPGIAKCHVQLISGKKISSGVPSLAWVVMGMQEGYMAYGWHNQYNENVYRENNCDTETTNEIVREDFKECLNYFAHNPAYTIKFFYQKTLSQWENPTFEAFWINDLTKRKSDGIKVKPLDGFLKSLSGEPGNKYIKEYCNFFESFVLVGVSFWLLFGWRKIKMEELLLATIFIGGFIFHLFWEAKCQYIMPYFVLLFPYAYQGFCELVNILNEYFLSRRQKKSNIFEYKKLFIVGCVIISILFLSLLGETIVVKLFGFGNEQYLEFLKQ